jgi:YD repeat-containing protein
MRKEVLAVAAAVLLGGCVSVGTKIDPNVVATFQPGVTTLQDAESKLGTPNSTTTASDGGTTIMYIYSHAQASGSSYIPVVGALVGHTDSDTVTSTLMFDKNGKYVRSTTSQGQTAAGMINHS